MAKIKKPLEQKGKINTCASNFTLVFNVQTYKLHPSHSPPL
jgi:hypothetical protein